MEVSNASRCLVRLSKLRWVDAQKSILGQITTSVQKRDNKLHRKRYLEDLRD